MRLVACSLVLFAACTQGDGDDYYTEPGGGGGSGTSSGTDAGGGDGSSAVIDGRVCGLSDILVWDQCNSTGMDDMLVILEGVNSVPAPDGTFQIAAPTSSGATWHVSGGNRVASLREYSGVLSIPSITNNQYDDLLGETGVGLDATAGTVFAEVIYNAAPLAGAAGSIPNLPSLVHYDDPFGSSKFSLGDGVTRATGKIWFPNVTPGNVNITVTPPGSVAGGVAQTKTVTVERETVTFVTFIFQNAPQ